VTTGQKLTEENEMLEDLKNAVIEALKLTAVIILAGGLLLAAIKWADAGEITWTEGDVVQVGAICRTVELATDAFNALRAGDLPAVGVLVNADLCRAVGSAEKKVVSTLSRFIAIDKDYEGEVMVLWQGLNDDGVILEYGMISWPAHQFHVPKSGDGA
jgi:hypothetical protein